MASAADIAGTHFQQQAECGAKPAASLAFRTINKSPLQLKSLRRYLCKEVGTVHSILHV